MKPTELMLGSVFDYRTEDGWMPTRLNCEDMEWIEKNDRGFWNDFFKAHRPIPLTPEIFEKCPLPEGCNWYQPIFSETYKFAVYKNQQESWTGTHVHTLQMFLRSIGLEWQLDGLFKEGNA